VEQKPVRETRTLDTVISQDTQLSQPKLIESRTMASIKAGLLAPMSSEDLVPAIRGLAMGHAELDDAWVDVGAGLVIPGGSDGDYGYGGIELELGGGYHLTHTATAAFIGGGVDLRLAGGERIDTGVQLVPFATVGVEFMRDATSRFTIEARVGQNALPLTYDADGYDYYSDGSHDSKKIYPTELGLLVGVAL
jgi:hypothetical protein